MIQKQCLGSGNVRSATVWLPGSGSGKICGSTNLDQGKKLKPNPNMLLSKHKLKFLTNNITKVSKLLNVSFSLTKKIREERKMFENFSCVKTYQ